MTTRSRIRKAPRTEPSKAKFLKKEYTDSGCHGCDSHFLYKNKEFDVNIVLLCALGVGGATVLGAVIGFFARDISLRFSDTVLSYAAGIMLSASVINLILPSLENGGKYALLTTFIGILLGALCLTVSDRLIPDADHINEKASLNDRRRRSVMLFVLAIAIHNLPEGLAAGVGFGTGNMSDAFLIASGIALQNLPEGMVIINPMISVGIKPRWAFLIAA